MSDEMMYDSDVEDNLCHENSNVQELRRLLREIDHIMEQGISPPASWYEKRYKQIEIYAELGWMQMARRFENCDGYLYNASLNTMNRLEDRMDEYHRKGYFDLQEYQYLLSDIDAIWNYYTTKYIGNESDPDVGDLIVGLTHLMNKL